MTDVSHTARQGGAQVSPASVVLVTFKKEFGAVVLPEPEPRRIPAQASLIVLPVKCCCFR